MEPSILVKKAVQMMFEDPQEGDLLMDAPITATWASLCKMAADREKWRRIVQTFKMSRIFKTAPTRTSNRLAGRPPPAANNEATATATTAQQQKKPSTMTEAQKYRARDEHEALLRPATKENMKFRWKRASKKKKKAKKPAGPTDKQRAAKTHAHCLIHHVPTADAATFLQTNPRANRITMATETKLKLMITNPFSPAEHAIVEVVDQLTEEPLISSTEGEQIENQIDKR